MANQTVTSRDVARLAGVSQATVSAVINNTRFVSPDTRVRVEKAIARLNFRPNALARSLKMRTTRVIGLVLPTLISPWWSSVVGFIDRTALARGYSIMLAQTDNDPARELRLIQALIGQQVAGFIMVPS